MPASTPQPAWFNPTWYAQQKWLQHNVMYPDDQWASVEDYNQALASFNATNWENWDTEYGNADNVSPNPLFDEAYYFQALANNSNARHTNGKTDWNPTTIKEYLHTEYNASGWDHYTLQGQFEGLNPSAQFDTNAYYQIRVNMLNAYNNGAGWDNHGWTVDQYKEILRDAQINPIMDLYLNTDYGQPNATQTIAAVSSPLTVDPTWTPWGTGTPVVPAWEPDATQALTTKAGETLTGATGVETLFTAVVSTGSDNTLNPDDQIHADAKVENHMNVTMKANFMPGFSGVSGDSGTTANVTGVSVVQLTNNDNATYAFSGQNMEGVTTWNLVNTANTSVISLANLPTPGITVNITGQKQGNAEIGFNPSSVGNNTDALTLGLSGVGMQRSDQTLPISVTAKGIENLTVNSTGAANYVALGAIPATTLTITGAAPLTVARVAGSGGATITEAMNSGMTTIDGSAATGALYLVARPATALKNVELGSGNDTLVVTSMVANGTIDGGSGNDTLVFDKANAAINYNLNMDNVETLTVQNNTAALNFNGTYMNGLQTLNVVKCQSAVTLNNTDQASLNVNIQGNGYTGPGSNNPTKAVSAITVDDVAQLNISLGDQKTDTTEYYNDAFTARDATSMTLTLNQGGDTAQTTWAGAIVADKLTSLTVNSLSDNSLLQMDVAGTSTLSSLANITLNGSGDMDFHRANIGQKAARLEVAAQNLSGDLDAKFIGNGNTSNPTQALVVNSGTGDDAIQVNSSYSYLSIITGAGDDDVDLHSFTAKQISDLDFLYISLGGQTADRIWVADNAAATALINKIGTSADFTAAQVKVYGTTGDDGSFTADNDYSNTFGTGWGFGGAGQSA